MGKIKSRVEFLRLGTIMIMLPGLIMLDMLTNEYDLVAGVGLADFPFALLALLWNTNEKK